MCVIIGLLLLLLLLFVYGKGLQVRSRSEEGLPSYNNDIEVCIRSSCLFLLFLSVVVMLCCFSRSFLCSVSVFICVCSIVNATTVFIISCYIIPNSL